MSVWGEGGGEGGGGCEKNEMRLAVLGEKCVGATPGLWERQGVWWSGGEVRLVV